MKFLQSIGMCLESQKKLILGISGRYACESGWFEYF